MRRFSKSFKTFGQWLRARPRTSSYAKEIMQKHNHFPQKSLSQLRTTTVKSQTTVAWNNLTPSEKVSRNQAFEALRLMRKGSSLRDASKAVNLSEREIKRQLGPTLRKVNGRWSARKHDSIQRQMTIYSKGRRLVIVTRNSRYASLIGSYLADVRHYLETGNHKYLRKYRGKFVIDANGQKHFFETNTKTVREIDERIEDREFQEIYSDD
jgi:hypothetical protein